MTPILDVTAPPIQANVAAVLTLAGDSYRTRARRELLAKNRDK